MGYTILKFVSMKFLFLIFLSVTLTYNVQSQTHMFDNLWGEYEYDKNTQISFKICEQNEWSFTNCHVKWWIDSHGEQIADCINDYFEISGKYCFIDSIIYLNSRNDSLFFVLKIIDTLNLLVLYAKDFFEKGDYLNRTMAFFPNHYCGFGLPDYNNLRWIIFHAGEIWLFKRPENFLISKDFEIIKLHEGYWKKN
jgi:hypothetical protein